MVLNIMHQENIVTDSSKPKTCDECRKFAHPNDRAKSLGKCTLDIENPKTKNKHAIACDKGSK